MEQATQGSNNDLGNIEVFRPHIYSLEGRFFDTHFNYVFANESRFSQGDLELGIADTELAYPEIQRALTPLIIGMSEVLTSRETGERKGFHDVHFLGRDVRGFHYWVNEIDSRKSGNDEDVWKLYDREEILRRIARIVKFSEDLEDHPFISWLKKPIPTKPEQPKFDEIKYQGRIQVYPLYSRVFTGSCRFVFPEKSPGSRERNLEIRIARSVTDQKAEHLLTSPLIIELIETVGEARFRDIYYAIGEMIVDHDWMHCRIHPNGHLQYFPELCGSEHGLNSNVEKLFRYGDAIEKMLKSDRIESVLQEHPIFPRLASKTLSNLPYYRKFNQETAKTKELAIAA